MEELTEKKSDRSRLTEIVNERGTDRHDSKAQGDSRDIITRSNDLAQHIRWNLENDIRDIENAQNSIVIVTFETEVLLETS